MKLKVHSRDGKATRRTVTLEPAAFVFEPNDHAIWLDVRRIQSNARQGTHKTKERSETVGSGRKLYRQKGTGRARSGDAKSPIRRSGGRTFGPRPRDYRLKINRKTQRLARRSAMAYKAQEKAIGVIEDFSFDQPSTSELKAILAAMDLTGRKVLLLTNGVQAAVARSCQNLSDVVVREVASVSTFDVLKASFVLIQEGAIETLMRVVMGDALPETA